MVKLIIELLGLKLCLSPATYVITDISEQTPYCMQLVNHILVYFGDFIRFIACCGSRRVWGGLFWSVEAVLFPVIQGRSQVQQANALGCNAKAKAGLQGRAKKFGIEVLTSLLTKMILLSLDFISGHENNCKPGLLPSAEIYK